MKKQLNDKAKLLHMDCLNVEMRTEDIFIGVKYTIDGFDTSDFTKGNIYKITSVDEMF
jgi:hypothetical protein